MNWLDYLVLGGYFATMIAIGIWSTRRVKGQEDYFMGGRGFGKLLQTFAAFGAGTGAHEPANVGRTSWTSGLSGVWSALLWLFATPVYWIVAVWYRRMRHLTLGDWFVERYESRWLGAAYSVFAIVFYMWYLSTMFSAIASSTVPLLGFSEVGGVDIKYVLVPGIAAIVIAYGVLGGLTAAYYTDLIQGLFIILLSVLLIPFGLQALVKAYGDPSTMGIMDGFTILHQRVAGDYFNLFTGPSAGEFTFSYIISLSLLGLVGIVVQPHFIATGGGSAKSEDEARIGLVVGNFLKRLCTVGWAMTALIALALLAGNAEIILDPDQVWGVATREILGPANLGLVGLMLACLLAAMMSSADAYMIVTSALVTRNVYAAFINPNASEKTYVRVGRMTGFTIIVGAAVIAVTMADVFKQFKLTLELPILFAAPFWLGMYWRRVNRTAVWLTIAFSLLVFFILPMGLPAMMPSLRTNPTYTTSTYRITRTSERQATAADVARYEAWKSVQQTALEKGDEQLLKRLGTAPPTAVEGEMIQVKTVTPGKAIFWSGGVEAVGSSSFETVDEFTEGTTKVVVEKPVGEFVGKGDFNLDFLLFALFGVDLSSVSNANLETLRLPARLVTPFVVLFLLSLVTPRNSAEVLSRFYAKMNTEVDRDPEADRRKLEQAYANPAQYDQRKLFPRSEWEFVRPNAKDWIGFLAAVAVCGAIIGILVGLAAIGAG